MYMNLSKKEKNKYIFLVNILFAVYSLTNVLAKFAAAEGTVSFRFLLLYGGSLCLMMVYAIVWQQVIKKLPLMVAYANKAVIVFWGLIWGILFFNEKITLGKFAGVVMVMAGIVLFAGSEGSEGEEQA